ncbi:p-loop nucleoside triphosphate hydrolase superfamily protein [Quillaja saponaria]|uniref:P-loop nucleoside triphosphate hydrolase superfamily protein n=1 Tax=Quillaja saponaria TaxID=32244 RepID=A0AAD7LUA2_QUISA|nr:p-loop nucleoside triphosphate hydrolase superfamily protein [Quillaja saponaria]
MATRAFMIYFLNIELINFSNVWAPLSGWKHHLESMDCLLQNPKKQYDLYKRGNNDDQEDDLMTLEQFLLQRFRCIRQNLKNCMETFYTHLPTSFISLEVVKNMLKALELLKSLEDSLRQENIIDNVFTKFSVKREECLRILKSLSGSFSVPNVTDKKSLSGSFSVPNVTDKYAMEAFCLKNACLVFSTAASSAKLFSEGMSPVELLVIDEAAQLKECESTIPLQLPGLRHAVLIGDEKQLPAMVKSQISGSAEYGRSLFERLVMLGHKKHLLNVQYRMHPSISVFPNREFYDEKLSDASSVKERSYNKCFLEGNMFSSYSFIHVARGKEDRGGGHSFRNMVEVAAVSEIIERLYKEYHNTKRKISIGVISPYNSQVYEIQEEVKQYATVSDSNFCVSIRSVDGFQGGEEDIIIISTVRSNGDGKGVSFLTGNEQTCH